MHETQLRLVRIREQLIADVKFAHGLLGHLEKGGHFSVEQQEILPGQSDLTFMEVNMKGKALFFKTIAIQEKEYRSGFRTVPDSLTLAEARGHVDKASCRGCQPIALKETCSPVPVEGHLEVRARTKSKSDHRAWPICPWRRLYSRIYAWNMDYAGTDCIQDRVAR